MTEKRKGKVVPLEKGRTHPAGVILLGEVTDENADELRDKIHRLIDSKPPENIAVVMMDNAEALGGKAVGIIAAAYLKARLAGVRLGIIASVMTESVCAIKSALAREGQIVYEDVPSFMAKPA